MTDQIDEKTKFYVPPELVDPNLIHAVILFPFWGIPSFDDSPFMSEVFHSFAFDTKYYELVEEIKDADFVLVPYRYNVLKAKRPGLFEQFLAVARKHKKPLFIDGCSDLEYPIPFKEVYALRVGGYKFLKSKNDITIPFYADDLLQKFYQGKFVARAKKPVPSVGFVGWASLAFLQKIKTILKETPVRVRGLFDSHYRANRKGIFFREKAVKLFSASKLIQPNFLIRGSYSGHVNTAGGDIKKLRKEFVDNLFESDYALAIRGDGNFSVRFYEALSLGRVPVLIDTECVLGFEDIIDYDEFIVRIDFRDLKNADKILASFHQNLTNEAFRLMQEKARAAYLEYMRPDNMSKHLMRKLKNIARNYTP